MRVFSFFKVDWIMTMFQRKLLVLWIMITLFLSIMHGDPYWGPLYMGFGGMMLSTMPFGIKQKSDTGFLLMLPGTERERVMGRFFFGFALFALCLFLGGIASMLVVFSGENKLENGFAMFTGLLGTGMIFIAVEYTILYLIGELKSRYFMNFICMIPGFLFFFGGTWVFSSEEEGVEKLYQYFLWINHHMVLSVGILFTFAVLIFVSGIFISVQAVKKRDFS